MSSLSVCIKNIDPKVKNIMHNLHFIFILVIAWFQLSVMFMKHILGGLIEKEFMTPMNITMTLLHLIHFQANTTIQFVACTYE